MLIDRHTPDYQVWQVLKREAHIVQPHERTDGTPGLCEQEGVPCHLRMGLSTWDWGGHSRQFPVGKEWHEGGDGGWAGPHCQWPPANTGGLC